MSAIKVAHVGDVHFCDKFLDEVGRCMNFAIDYLQDHVPDLIVIPGDTFDHKLEQNSPALFEAIEAVSCLANIAPTLILQGTLSHDAPHAIDIFKSVQAANEIFVVDHISQVVLIGGIFKAFKGTIPTGATALLSCLPSVNKGHVAAAVGAENAAHVVGEHVSQLLQGWAPSHLAARAAGVPTIFMSHGTVNGSITEHGCPMVGFDHELTTGTVFASEASATMVNHIHKHQSWRSADGTRVIAYPGSLGRLHFGEIDPKGFLIWTVTPDSATFEFIETPAKQLVEIEFAGTPNMEELARLAKSTSKNAHVRIRFVVDEEHRASVDKNAIAALFSEHAETKIEGRIAPIQRQRAAGIGQAPSLAEKLTQWCELTGTDPVPLQVRLMLLLADTIKKEMEAAA